MRPQFLGIEAGQTKTGEGVRVTISEDGERVWMHGKWLDLAEHHAVAWIEGRAEFGRPDGKVLRPGQFPAWTVRAGKPGGPLAMMFDRTQFIGGELRIRHGRSVQRIPIR